MNRQDLTFFILGKKYGFDMRNNVKFVMESQFWNSDKVLEYQSNKIRTIIKHAYNNVNFYKRLFDEYQINPEEIKEPKDLQKIPVIRKQQISQNFNDCLADNFKYLNVREGYTGGTTGKPFHIYTDINSWALNWATKIRTFKWGGYEFGLNKLGVMAGGSLLPQKHMGFQSMLWQRINNYFAMPITRMDNRILMGYLLELRRRKVMFLRGYPSALYTLALFAKEQRFSITMKAIFTTAEMLYDFQREILEEVFSCKCFDQYGCEGMAGASECDYHSGLHINIETSYLDIVGRDGLPSEPGKEGEVVVTSYNDFAMPLIRYAPGDTAVKSKGKCSCGRTLPLLAKIYGRTSDIIKLSNGRIINGLSIPFEDLGEKIEQFQIHQTSESKIELLLVIKSNFTISDEHKIMKMMHFHCGNETEIVLKYVDVIPTPSSGKIRYIISDLN